MMINIHFKLGFIIDFLSRFMMLSLDVYEGFALLCSDRFETCNKDKDFKGHLRRTLWGTPIRCIFMTWRIYIIKYPLSSGHVKISPGYSEVKENVATIIHIKFGLKKVFLVLCNFMFSFDAVEVLLAQSCTISISFLTGKERWEFL